ncbi:MAG TPA: CoA transferase [Rhodospirillaceae bacterium]|nr:CoA transferase [Rhodospirillaceae bacterium]|tara:strand:+ start:1409 stop:2608 length:1200 start_codon:yes stop_codon:yes gene_type:complete
MTLPLEGIRVLDLTRALSGPFCTMILGDLGADVLKAEPVGEGDMCRAWGPFDKGIGCFFLSVNRNKRSLAVDFRSAEGQETLRELALQADVLVENFKPGTIEKLGLDYGTLKKDNPRLIHATITGFGSDGPYGTWPGFDQIAQGMSGMMSLSGEPDGPPTRLGVPLADLVSGMWLSTGITAAIHQRTATGQGQKVDTSLLAAVVGMLCVQGQRYLSLGDVPARAGNEHPVIYPYGAFQASDALVNIAAANQAQWKKLCDTLGLSDLVDDPDFTDNTLRDQNRARLRGLLNEKLAAKTAIEWSKELMEAGIPAGPVYDLGQMFNDPQVQHQGMVETITHPVIGDLAQLSNPLRLGEVGPKTVRIPPPALGEHSAEVLADWGLATDRIDSLIAGGHVQPAK